MNLYKLEKQHYPIVAEWWKKHNHFIIPEDSLSSIGLIVYDNNKPICASWLYIMSGCKLGQIAWTTTNPECGLKERYNAINFCLDGLIELANHYERESIINFSNSSGLTKILKKKNLVLGSKHDLLFGKLEE